MGKPTTEIYEKITKYYEFSDKLVKEIENSTNSVEQGERAKILLPIAKETKQTADKLIEEYIKYMKNEGDACGEKIKELIDELIEKIGYCKTKIYDLYRQK